MDNENNTVWVKAMPDGDGRWIIHGTKCYRTKDAAMRSSGILLPFKFVELQIQCLKQPNTVT